MVKHLFLILFEKNLESSIIFLSLPAQWVTGIPLHQPMPKDNNPYRWLDSLAHLLSATQKGFSRKWF